MNNELLATKLKELRKAAGYTQDYVAVVLGIARQTYSHYETGKRTPDAKALYILSGLYDISIEDLLHLCIDLDPEFYYDAPVPTSTSLDFNDYLEYINGSAGQRKVIECSEKEKRLLYYFHLLTPTDKNELIEIAKIKLKKACQTA